MWGEECVMRSSDAARALNLLQCINAAELSVLRSIGRRGACHNLAPCDGLAGLVSRTNSLLAMPFFQRLCSSLVSFSQTVCCDGVLLQTKVSFFSCTWKASGITRGGEMGSTMHHWLVLTWLSSDTGDSIFVHS